MCGRRCAVCVSTGGLFTAVVVVAPAFWWRQMLLSREEFIRVFGMKVSEFRALPEFRRRALKIKAKLHVPNKKKRGT